MKAKLMIIYKACYSMINDNAGKIGISFVKETELFLIKLRHQNVSINSNFDHALAIDL